MNHAKLSASTSHMWMNCPGSIRMCEGIPRRPSAAATLGTSVHALGAHIIKGSKGKVVGPGFKFKFNDGGEEKSAVATAEMIYGAEAYAARVHGHMKAKGSMLFLEQRVSLEHVRSDMFGTADAVIVQPAERRMVVIDYKNGYVPVRLEESCKVNTQLLFYAAGALASLGALSSPILDVQLEIIQPNCPEVEPVQSIALPASEVKSWAENDLWEAAVATESPDAPLKAGSHCRWCPAAAQCPALRKSVQLLAGADFSGIAAPVSIQVPESAYALSQILKAAPLVESWLKACEARAFDLMAAGGKVEGFKLVRKKSNRKWPVENPTELLGKLRAAGVKNLLRNELYGAPELLSPAQLEKGSAALKAAVAQVAVKPEAGLTVAFESDRRQAESASPGQDFADAEELL